MDVAEVDDDTDIKIITLGEANVGKTSLIDRFTTGTCKEIYKATYGLEMNCRYVRVNGQEYVVCVCDTAGTERYKAVSRSYCNKADGALLTYDVTKSETYSKLIYEWLPLAQSQCKKNVAILIVGNKIDQPNRVDVTVKSLRQRAELDGLEFMTSSAKENTNVDEVFFKLIKRIALNKGIVNEGTDPSIEKIPGDAFGYKMNSKPTLQASSKLPKYTGKIILPSQPFTGLSSKNDTKSNSEMSTQTDVVKKNGCC